MQQRTKELVELAAYNRQEIGKAYKRRIAESDQLATAALTWTLSDKRADAGAIVESIEYLKSQAGVLSAERGDNGPSLVAYMTMSGDRVAYLARVRAIFAKIMEGKKVASSSRFGAAMIIANNTDTDDEAMRVAERAEMIFERMRETHPMITNDRDRTFATLLALSDRDAEAILADAEECYQLLSDGYKMTEGRQTMANILSLSPASPAQKVARIKELRAAFKENKISIGWLSSQEHAILALLANDSRPAAEIGADVAEIVALLKKQKGFGGLVTTNAIRVLGASTISSLSHTEQESSSTMTAISLAIFQAVMDWIILMVIIMP